MGQLTALIGRQVAWRVAGRAASFGILLTMIADGSTCCLMSDGDAISDIGGHQWVAISVQSISWSIGQKACFLGRSVADSEASDDDFMISMADPWCWRRLTDFMLQKSDFGKITGANHLETWKGAKTVGFQAKSDDLDPYGRRRRWGRRPWAMVAGDHGTFVPFRSPFGRRFFVFFISSFSCIFLEIFPHLFTWFSWGKLDEKPCKSEHKVFLFFENPKTL